MVAFAETSRPARRAYARQCVGSSSCAPGKNPSLRVDRNQQYSVTALTNASGGVVERNAYTAYGQPVFFDGSGMAISSSAENNRMMYTGQEWDDDLGLYHYRARMYDAVTGRFCSRDPIGYGGSEGNLYEYIEGRALIGVDPMGDSIIIITWPPGTVYDPDWERDEWEDFPGTPPGQDPSEWPEDYPGIPEDIPRPHEPILWGEEIPGENLPPENERDDGSGNCSCTSKYKFSNRMRPRGSNGTYPTPGLGDVECKIDDVVTMKYPGRCVGEDCCSGSCSEFVVWICDGKYKRNRETRKNELVGTRWSVKVGATFTKCK